MSREGNRPRRARGPMGGGHGMRGPAEKAKDFKGTMRTLISYLAKYKLSIIIVFIFAIGSVTFSVIGPKILGKATTEIFNGLVSKVSGEGTGIDFEVINFSYIICCKCDILIYTGICNEWYFSKGSV